MESMSINEIYQRLEQLKGWELTGNEITKDFQFNDFKAAMEFVNNIAAEAERVDHHPDITIKYNKVRISITTHSDSGLTYQDFELAKFIEQIV